MDLEVEVPIPIVVAIVTKQTGKSTRITWYFDLRSLVLAYPSLCLSVHAFQLSCLKFILEIDGRRARSATIALHD